MCFWSSHREIVDNHEKENALNIVTEERTYHIYAESPEDARYFIIFYQFFQLSFFIFYVIISRFLFILFFCLFLTYLPVYLKMQAHWLIIGLPICKKQEISCPLVVACGRI